jgi:hypothetical protein
MDRRVWRARAQGGYTRVFEVADGVEKSAKISVPKKLFGEQIARELNNAYELGARDAEADHARAAKGKIADLLREMGHDKAADLVQKAPI